MKRIAFFAAAAVMLTLLSTVFAQTQQAQQNSESASEPAQMKTGEFLDIRNVSFNKKIDRKGRGEVLEVEFEIINSTDVPQELYIHVFATDEQVVWKRNTFFHAIEDEDQNVLLNFNKDLGRNLQKQNIDIRYFTSDPDDRGNYEHQLGDKTVLMKYPKNKKAGIDPASNSAYKLQDKIVYHNDFLCNYRKRYKFFNHVTILVFDDEEKLVYRQIWSLNGKRR